MLYWILLLNVKQLHFLVDSKSDLTEIIVPSLRESKIVASGFSLLLCEYSNIYGLESSGFGRVKETEKIDSKTERLVIRILKPRVSTNLRIKLYKRSSDYYESLSSSLFRVLS